CLCSCRYFAAPRRHLISPCLGDAAAQEATRRVARPGASAARKEGADQYLAFFRFAGCPRGGGGGAPASRSSTSLKSILRSSRLALSTMIRTRSPRRYSRPRRSPVSVL